MLSITSLKVFHKQASKQAKFPVIYKDQSISKELLSPTWQSKVTEARKVSFRVVPCTLLGYDWSLPWSVPMSVCTDHTPGRSACAQEWGQLLCEWPHTFCHSLPVTWLEQKTCQLTWKLWLWWSYTGTDLTSFICPLTRSNLNSQSTPLKLACLFPGKKACFWFLFTPHTIPTIIKTAVGFLKICISVCEMAPALKGSLRRVGYRGSSWKQVATSQKRQAPEIQSTGYQMA